MLYTVPVRREAAKGQDGQKKDAGKDDPGTPEGRYLHCGNLRVLPARRVSFHDTPFLHSVLKMLAECGELFTFATL
jgi:hypothetical protein